MSNTVEYVQIDSIGVVRLRRPATHNALHSEMLMEVVTAVETAAADSAVRGIILIGGSRAFSTGEDLTQAAELDVDQFRAQIEGFQRLATALRHAPKPTIAAVAGFAYGGGAEIAANCDARIAATNVRFACPETEWGLTLTNGASVLLRRLVGEGWARELLLFGAVVDADTALRIGLVTRVVEVDELEAAALEMARKAARFSPLAIQRTKQLLNDEYPTWQALLDAEVDVVVRGFASGDVKQRLQNFAARKGGSAA
jgi:enoyl-CoA hydratase/carnithine racemase